MRLMKTCDACPEQYDVYQGKLMVGYIRLRGGRFQVTCPDVGGEEVLCHHFEDQWKGQFDDDGERKIWLDQAKAAIRGWMKDNNVGV